MGGVNSTYLLHTAASDGNLEDMKKLVNHGVNIEAAYIKGRTPLLQCFYSSLIPQERRLALAMYLTSIGANVNAADHRGWTPLHYSADRGDVQAVQLLLNNGAKTWTRDTYGRTAASLTQNDAEGHACYRLIKNASDREGKPFPFSLEAPMVVGEGANVTVRFTSTPNHSLYDYIQIYYAVLGSWTMTARIGSFQYVPDGPAGEVVISLKGIELHYPIRALYFSYESQKFVAATAEFCVVEAEQLPKAQALGGDPARKTAPSPPPLSQPVPSQPIPSPTPPPPQPPRKDEEGEEGGREASPEEEVQDLHAVREPEEKNDQQQEQRKEQELHDVKEPEEKKDEQQQKEQSDDDAI